MTTVTIDPGNYSGRYAVDLGTSHVWHTGKQSFELSSGTHYIDTGAGVGVGNDASSFSFEIDANGAITNISNPTAARIDGNTIHFYTTQIKINPVNYGAKGGTYDFTSYPGTIHPNVEDFWVVRGLLYSIDNNTRVNGSSFLFYVNTKGEVESRSDAATGHQKMLTFNTTLVEITPVSCTDPYSVGGYGIQNLQVKLPFITTTVVSLSVNGDVQYFKTSAKTVEPTQIQVGGVTFNLKV